MALKISAGDDVKRGDMFFVDPFQVIVKEDLRGRHKPVTQENIVDMALSLLEHGQRQPVECRRVEGNRIQLNLGFTRTNAARLIREGFEYDSAHHQDAEFKLKVQVVDCNDQEAFVHNVVENAHRNDTSDVDDAHNHNRLRDRYGYSDADIARLYGYKGQVKVGRLRQLLQLEEFILDLVHEGRLPTTGALELLEIPAEDRRLHIDLLLEASSNGKVRGSDVRTAIRDHILNDDGKEDDGKDDKDDGESPSSAAKPRSMREVRQFFQQWEEGEEPDLARFSTDFLRWLSGKATDRALDNAMGRILGA